MPSEELTAERVDTLFGEISEADEVRTYWYGTDEEERDIKDDVLDLISAARDGLVLRKLEPLLGRARLRQIEDIRAELGGADHE